MAEPMDYKKYHEFTRELVELKARAMELELYRTGHELERAVTMVGFEVAKVTDGVPIPEKYIEQRFA